MSHVQSSSSKSRSRTGIFWSRFLMKAKAFGDVKKQGHRAENSQMCCIWSGFERKMWIFRILFPEAHAPHAYHAIHTYIYTCGGACMHACHVHTQVAFYAHCVCMHACMLCMASMDIIMYVCICVLRMCSRFIEYWIKTKILPEECKVSVHVDSPGSQRSLISGLNLYYIPTSFNCSLCIEGQDLYTNFLPSWPTILTLLNVISWTELHSASTLSNRSACPIP
jgi:hypothetical protein